MRLFLRLFSVLILWLSATACGHKPPYNRANRPSSDALLATTAPQLQALAVSDASVTINRIARADLAMLAEAPNRFRGSVTKKGNELVELAFHEDGYALRYKLDAWPTGYYHGPPSPCAVQAMLQVPFTYEGLVALVLGGGPTLQPPYEVVDQKWDRSGGYETVVIGNAQYLQELRFTVHGGQWRFTGAAMWQRQPRGSKGRKVWDLLHDKFGTVGGAVLPGRTKITAPGKRRDVLVVINYSGRNPKPPWASQPSEPTTNSGDSGSATPPEPEGGWEDDDDDGWEDGEEGWEGDENPGEKTPKAPPKSEAGRGEEGGETGDEAGTSNPPPNVTKTVLPQVFVVGGQGLSDRGDLCR